MSGTYDGPERRAVERDLNEALIESIFVGLEHQPSTADPTILTQRFASICEVWPAVTSPYEYLKLAHFLAGDSSIAAQELHDAALRTAWRLRTPASDPWDDAWWFDALAEIPDVGRAERLRLFAQQSGSTTHLS